MIKDAFQENLAVCKLPGIWTALNLEQEIKTQKNNNSDLPNMIQGLKYIKLNKI